MTVRELKNLINDIDSIFDDREICGFEFDENEDQNFMPERVKITDIKLSFDWFRRVMCIEFVKNNKNF